MAYTKFLHRPPDPECKDWPPAFYNLDGSPVYENSRQTLLISIIFEKDIEALDSYIQNPQMEVFKDSYENDENPFFFAMISGSLDMLRVLIQHYLSDTREPLVEYLTRQETYLLHEACMGEYWEMFSWLLHHDLPLRIVHPRALSQVPLHYIISCIRILQDFDKEDPKDTSPSASRQRMHKMRENRSRYDEYIGWLLENGFSVSDSNIYESPQNGAEIGMLESSILSYLVPFASYEMIASLIAKGADIHARIGRFRATPLHDASFLLNLEAIQALIDHHGSIELTEMVSIPDSYGRLPLHWALVGDEHLAGYDLFGLKDEYSDEILSRTVKTIQLLLDANPDTVNARDQDGASVLHYVAKSRMNNAAILQIVGTLLDNGADAGLYDSKGNSILHLLSKRSWLASLIPAILDRVVGFVDINQTDFNGCTALHYLVMDLDQIEAVRHLVYSGADVNIIDLEGNSALHKVMGGNLFSRIQEPWGWVVELVGSSVRDLQGKLKNYQLNRNEELVRIIGQREAQASDPLKRLRDDIIQVLLHAGASMDRINTAGKTSQQVLEGVLENRTVLRQREEEQRQIQEEQQRQIQEGQRQGRRRGRDRAA